MLNITRTESNLETESSLVVNYTRMSKFGQHRYMYGYDKEIGREHPQGYFPKFAFPSQSLPPFS